MKPATSTARSKCGNQRYKCATCGLTFVEEGGPLGNMRVTMKEATMALALMSIRAA